ncbi:hypothetical protein [Amycolatopsis palatopharyngis]|uniref:hypothetical protein n=1 Tax=Amycolatopsis palatopharyngis TaxID=187982 RepID=UPI000E234631|nr:hypothetical protein [Amycolatopsis palatopharyngis]
MTSSVARSGQRIGASVVLAVQALRAWTARQVLVAIAAGVGVAVVVGVATVLIPNPVFGREIPPVWWNYPVWLVASALSGMLVATYVRAKTVDGPADGTGAADTDMARVEREGGAVARRSSRMGMAGGILAWFAVGCPVCNKLALLALGYSGAITWFAPVQPFLALGALILTGVALVWRLRGQVACPVRPEPMVVAR